MNRRSFLAALSAATAGCTGNSGDSASSTTTTTSATTSITTTTRPKPDIEIVQVEMPSTAIYGERFPMRVTFENTGGAGGHITRIVATSAPQGFVALGKVSASVPAGESKTVTAKPYAAVLGTQRIHLTNESGVTIENYELDVSRRVLEIGATFEYLRDGLKMTVTGWESPDRLPRNVHDSYLYPDEGTQYGLFRVNLENPTTDTIYFGLSTELALEVGGTRVEPRYEIPDRIYTVVTVDRDMLADPLSIEPAESANGWVWFQFSDEFDLGNVQFGRIVNDEIPVYWSPGA